MRRLSTVCALSVASMPAMKTLTTAVKWCSGNSSDGGGNNNSGGGGGGPRESWLASLPVDRNRASLRDVEPLLSDVFTPGEMQPQELEAYLEACAAANTKMGEKKNPSTNTSSEEASPHPPPSKFVLDPYIVHFPEHLKAVEASVALFNAKARALGPEERKALSHAGGMLGKDFAIVRSLAENFPKLWHEFLMCGGNFGVDDGTIEFKSADEMVLALVCRHFQDGLPAGVLQERKGSGFEFVPPPHSVEAWWAFENAANSGDLFLSTRSAEAASSTMVSELRQMEDTSQKIRILDAGCGVGNFGLLLQRTLSGRQNVPRPEVSVSGFDASLHALSFLSGSLESPSVPQVPGFNLYNDEIPADEGGSKTPTMPLLCVDPCAAPESFGQMYVPSSFDYIVACDFLLVDPTYGNPGLRTFNNLFELLKPGGKMLVFNSMSMMSPQALAGYDAALKAGERSSGRPFSFTVVRPPNDDGGEPSEGADDAGVAKLQREVSRIPVFARSFVKN